MQNKELIKSPLNYTGGKFRLLPQILPLFPKDVDCFYDIFCGGANVAINFNAKKIVAIDINEKVINLYTYFLSQPYNILLKKINDVINIYGLSNSQKESYDYYKCNSSDGLGAFNKEAYSKIKKDYNDPNYHQYDKNLLFYILIAFGFNNQIRFNLKGEFNIPVGKRDFNKNMELNLKNFYDKIKNINISFTTSDFANININKSEKNFVYADPPYLITTATYNEANGWNEDKEKQLLAFLTELDNKKISFALSNVIENKNKKNEILEKWIKEHNYHVHELNFSYNNSSYQTKNNNSVTREVLITNYTTI